MMTDASVEAAVQRISSSAKGRRNLEDAFFLCDLGEVAKKYDEWCEYFPDIVPYYAVKAAPHDAMLKCLKVMGARFDCASQKEMERVIDAGAEPNDIILANTNKQTSDILFAKRVGVEITVFDKEEELLKIKKHYPDAKLILRIRTDLRYSVIKSPHTRFGATVENCQHLLRKAKEIGMNVVGLTFHVGTHCIDPPAYLVALRACKDVFNYAVEIGIKLTVLDIGGGFPGTDDGGCTMREISECIFSYLNELFPNAKANGLQIIAEPGRYFSAASYALATNVICKSEPFDKDLEVEYTINDGKYGSLSHIGPHGEYIPCIIKDDERELKISRVWGGTCSHTDYILERQLMPEMHVGEWLIWKNAGAYSFSTSSDFNGMRAETIYNIISSENSDVFRRRCGKKNFNFSG